MTPCTRGHLVVAGLLAVAVAVGGCSSDDGLSLPEMPKLGSLNPFAEKEEILPGKRISVLDRADAVPGDLAAASSPAVIPAPVRNESWTQPGGVATNSPGHLALEGGLKSLWTADAGQGSSSSGKLVASPIVVGGRVITLDASGRVTAFNASGGSKVWATALAPEHEDEDEGYGGGIASDGERIYAVTGFGTAVALDARSGSKLWEKPLGAPARSSPTVADGRIVTVTTDGRIWCLSTIDGSELWSFRGLQQTSSLLTNASPAIAGDLVVVPYPTGDVIALKVSSGELVWQENLTTSRSSSSFAAMGDPSRPVIDGGAVFAVGNAGRMVATAERTGERLWSLPVRSIQTPWVAGDSVYVVDVSGKLMDVVRSSGEVRWTVKLPGEETWSGPVLAGNRLWLVSASGKLVGVDAATGKVTSQRDIGQKVFISPVVADGRMYVLTDKATLIAFN